jgi:hypothetical protein
LMILKAKSLTELRVSGFTTLSCGCCSTPSNEVAVV